jgi:predicted  nucleic acid-binding Zn-ribbon protein
VSFIHKPDSMKSLPTLFLAVFIFYGVSAQQPIRVYEDSITYSKHKYPGVTVTIPEANYEKLQKVWKKELESKTKSSVVIENGEWSIFGANLKNLSPTPVNIYSMLNKMDSLVELRVAVELKKDVFVEKQTTEMLKLETYLKEFSKNNYLETAGSQLKVEEDTLRQLKKMLSEYEKNESNLNETIKSSEKSIKEEEDNISGNNSELETLGTEIDNQNTQYSAMADGPIKVEKAKYIKDLDKKQKKLGNDIKSSENRIKKANKEIEDAKKEIPEKQSLQAEIKKKIAAQELVVQNYQHKLDVIKTY